MKIMYYTTQRRLIFLFGFMCGTFALLTSAGAKPTLPFNLPTSFSSRFPSFTKFVERKYSDTMKSYSGTRLRNDSLLMIYYHDQTIAVTELGPDKILLSCELIEIYNDDDGTELLRELSKINKPFEINFIDMLRLMRKCQLIDTINNDLNNIHGTVKKRQSSLYEQQYSDESSGTSVATLTAGLFPTSPLTLFSGIIPGTKWCGTGDIAATYHDIGSESSMDRCCRTHDLCPVKIRAYQKRYDLENNSIYTKSHCTCDDMLYNCLKKTNTSAAQLMGSIYFNLVQVPCVLETKKGMKFRRAREGF